jgi:hypothetical protein
MAAGITKLKSTISAPYIPIIAAAFCLAAFFCIHNYYSQLGIVWNIERGNIVLTDDCPATNPFQQFASPSQRVPQQPPLCGLAIPYRFVLIAMIALATTNMILRTEKS